MSKKWFCSFVFLMLVVLAWGIRAEGEVVGKEIAFKEEEVLFCSTEHMPSYIEEGSLQDSVSPLPVLITYFQAEIVSQLDSDNKFRGLVFRLLHLGEVGADCDANGTCTQPYILHRAKLFDEFVQNAVVRKRGPGLPFEFLKYEGENFSVDAKFVTRPSCDPTICKYGKHRYRAPKIKVVAMKEDEIYEFEMICSSYVKQSNLPDKLKMEAIRKMKELGRNKVKIKGLIDTGAS